MEARVRRTKMASTARLYSNKNNRGLFIINPPWLLLHPGCVLMNLNANKFTTSAIGDPY